MADVPRSPYGPAQPEDGDQASDEGRLVGMPTVARSPYGKKPDVREQTLPVEPDRGAAPTDERWDAVDVAAPPSPSATDTSQVGSAARTATSGRVCPQCQAENGNDFQFCTECGSRLGESPAKTTRDQLASLKLPIPPRATVPGRGESRTISADNGSRRDDSDVGPLHDPHLVGAAAAPPKAGAPVATIRRSVNGRLLALLAGVCVLGLVGYLVISGLLGRGGTGASLVVNQQLTIDASSTENVTLKVDKKARVVLKANGVNSLQLRNASGDLLFMASGLDPATGLFEKWYELTPGQYRISWPKDSIPNNGKVTITARSVP